MPEIAKIGLGGGCHWCTEAVFQQLRGVTRVDQGYINSVGKESKFSEGVIVHFDPVEIALDQLIRVHLHTHSSTSDHSFREKYRSAVYYFDAAQAVEANEALKTISWEDFDGKIITRVLPFQSFEPSRESIRDYYQKNKDAPFCQRYIIPKLKLLREDFKKHLKTE